MIWFFIKKNFFDGWENIINILVPNIITVAIFALTGLGFSFFFSPNPISILIIYVMCLLAIALIIIFVSAFSENAESIANFGSATLGGYFSKIGTAFKENAKFAFLVAFITVSCVIGVPLYIGMDSFYGVALGMILLSFSVLMLLAFQWYLPIKILLKNDFKKCLKKCFIILFDNFGFSVFMAFYSLILLACSVILFFFLPGFNGILLGYVNALRLRLYKYDWLECHPTQKAEKERQNIPWDELIKEDETTLGKKSIKSLLMPWKAEHED